MIFLGLARINSALEISHSFFLFFLFFFISNYKNTHDQMIRPVALHSTATHEALATLNMDEARRTRILVHHP